MSRYIPPCDSNLYYAVRRFYFFTITSSYNAYFPCNKRSYIFKEQFLLLFAPMTTYLKALIQSIGRYGGHSWQEIGFKGFGCTSSISTWCGFLASKDIEQAPHVGGAITI